MITNLLFLVLVGLLFFLGVSNPNSLTMFKKLTKTQNKAIASMLFTGIVYLLYTILNVCSVDNFRFEVTPEKKCCWGRYMLSDDPEAIKYCESLSPEVLSSFCCGTGFHGKPTGFCYEPESDSKWENRRCCRDEPEKEEEEEE